jgi:Mlc titration factor MtfA (ptsG expression regulator)
MLRRRRGDRLLEPEWEGAVGALLERWSHFAGEERERVVATARTLDGRWHWEGLDGLAVTPDMRAMVAGTASLITAGVGTGVLADVSSVLIAPTTQTKTVRRRLAGSIMAESEACVSGEALLHGPVRIAWDRVRRPSGPGSGLWVIVHELAHKIDMADGVSDGTPPITGRERALEFQSVVNRTLEEIRSVPSIAPLRGYGATNRSELFAVACEAFFLRPAALRARFLDLHNTLAGYFGQDPAATSEAG